jgi:hypothetical protein
MTTAGPAAGGGRGSFGVRMGFVAALAALSVGVVIPSTSLASTSQWSASAGDPVAHSSAKSVKSTVNLAGLTGSVTGSVNSKKRKCEKRRLASLVLITPTGFDFVDTEKTTKKGAFSLKGAVAGQTYIVGVGKKTVTKFRFGKRPKKLLCTQTESDTFVP